MWTSFFHSVSFPLSIHDKWLLHSTDHSRLIKTPFVLWRIHVFIAFVSRTINLNSYLITKWKVLFIPSPPWTPLFLSFFPLSLLLLLLLPLLVLLFIALSCTSSTRNRSLSLFQLWFFIRSHWTREMRKKDLTNIESKNRAVNTNATVHVQFISVFLWCDVHSIHIGQSSFLFLFLFHMPCLLTFSLASLASLSLPARVS